MIVMKFGGTSVGSAQAIRRVGEIIGSKLPQKMVIVVSAMSGITDDLSRLVQACFEKNKGLMTEIINLILQKHKDVIVELNIADSESIKSLLKYTKNSLFQFSSELIFKKANFISDELISFGEFLSSNIIAIYLQSIKINGCMTDVRNILKTNSQYGNAQPLFEESGENARAVLFPLLSDNVIPILQGFIGQDSLGRTTTLGRGGSDYSATMIGAMLNTEAVEIWSDVDGVLTADPSIVPEARRIRSMSFDEAAELAYFGAKVLHPASILPAVEKDIPVYVLNSMQSNDGGTKISDLKNNGQNGCIVKSIAYKEGLTVIMVSSTRMIMAHGFMYSIFEIFNRYQTSVDLVSTSEVSVSITIDNTENLELITKELSRFAEVDVLKNKVIISVVGEQIRVTPGIPTQIFDELTDIPIHLISQGASEINISFVIDDHNINSVVKRLHDKFFSGELNAEIFA